MGEKPGPPCLNKRDRQTTLFTQGNQSAQRLVSHWIPVYPKSKIQNIVDIFKIGIVKRLSKHVLNYLISKFLKVFLLTSLPFPVLISLFHRLEEKNTSGI